VDTDQIAVGGADVNTTMLDSLSAQKRLLEDTIAAEERRAGSEKERLTVFARGLETEISELAKQSVLQAERLKVAESELAVGQQLQTKGYATAVDLRRRRMHAIEQQQGVSTLNQQLASRKNQLAETHFSLEQLPTTMGQKVQALRNELTAAEQRIAEISGRRSYLVKAPTSGRVSTVQATAGQSADPQRLQLEIVPDNAVLQAELFLPARAIGFVEANMPVRILYDAFPYQHFGTYSGRVLRVSQTILTNSDVVGPIALKEPAYRVTVGLAQEDIETRGRKIRLQPDMLLKADILLEKRSLMSWLVSPLLGIRT
jgi:membrane fusion protein